MLATHMGDELLTNLHMRKRATVTKLLLLAILLVEVDAAIAEDFDGSKPMVCEPLQGHDCLPSESTCRPLARESDKVLNFDVDVAKKKIRSPFRTELLSIQQVSRNAKSLILQGTNLETAWTVTIHRTTGRLTVAIADRSGAYVVFGQCRLPTASDVSK